MKLALAFALAVTTLAGCKKENKAGGDQDPAPVTGSGSAGGSPVAGSATTPPAPPPPPAPAPVPAGPNLADITRQVGAVLTLVADGIDVATMHGCSEAQDRVAELFEKSDEAAAGDLHGWLADPKLLAEAQTLMKDAKDPAIAAPLAKIDAAIKDCKKAVDVVAEWKTKLVQPQ